MDEKKRRESQAGLSVAIQTLLEAIPPSAFAAFHPDDADGERDVSIEDARLLLAGEMMASAYLLLEKNVAPRDILLNTWDLMATMTEVLSVDHLASLIPERPAGRAKGAASKAGATANAAKSPKKAATKAQPRSSAKAPSKAPSKASATPRAAKSPAKARAAQASKR